MPTIKGTDGDTTGALVTNITTPEQLTAMVLPATDSVDGALLATDKEFIDDNRDLVEAIAAAIAPEYLSDAIMGAVYQSAVVDLMSTGTHDVVMPAIPGKYFHLVEARLEVETRDATLTTGLTYDITQNGTSILDATQVVSAAVINSLAAPATFASNARVAGIQEVQVDVHCHQFKIVTPVAGAGLSDCTGRLIILGFFDV